MKMNFTVFFAPLLVVFTLGAAPTTQPASVLDFTVTDNAGQPVQLSRYKGQVLLVVNVASKCGLTPQYAQLQKLYETYKDKGLCILAFPANDFRQQEPGTNEQIREFCKSKYNVSFDLFAKIVVKGEGQSPLYQFLTDEKANAPYGGEIKWNFTKFLVGRDGKVAARFEPKTKPDEKQVIKAIEAELEKGR
jgi:glutathione peroxidase